MSEANGISGTRLRMFEMPEPFRRHYRQLVPASDEAIELVTSLPQNKDVMVTIEKRRNQGQHRKFFKLLSLAHENLPEHLSERWPDKDALRHELLIQTRNFDVHQTYGGATYRIPHSMSFDSMSQQRFELFYSASIRFICRHVIPEMDEGVLRDWVEEEVERFAA